MVIAILLVILQARYINITVEPAKSNHPGEIPKTICALYKETESCVQINSFTTTWFGTLQGVRQGDSLSPTLFHIYLNNLTKELKQMELGVLLGILHTCILLYADQIVLITENEEDLQNMLDHVGSLSNANEMKVANESKS